MMAAIEVEMKQRFGFRKNVKMIVRVGSWNSQIPFLGGPQGFIWKHFIWLFFKEM